jgi:hypothetical protein
MSWDTHCFGIADGRLELLDLLQSIRQLPLRITKWLQAGQCVVAARPKFTARIQQLLQIDAIGLGLDWKHRHLTVYATNTVTGVKISNKTVRISVEHAGEF